MARIVINGSIVKYPVGGLVQLALSYIIGLRNLGHEVFFIEKSAWADSCYDLSTRAMSNNCTYGINYISQLFKRYDLETNWSFMDHNKNFYGLGKQELIKLFKTCEIYLDLEWEDWEEGSRNVANRVFIDGEPGWFQIILAKMKAEGEELPYYDHYFTDGLNIGNEGCIIPSVGLNWKKSMVPVLIGSENIIPKDNDINTGFTTIMNWQSHKKVEFGGRSYGQKDIELVARAARGELIGVRGLSAASMAGWTSRFQSFS